MNNRIYSNRRIAPLQQSNKTEKTEQKKSRKSFNEILQKQLQEEAGIKFSGHAKKRLESRNIDLTAQDMQKLEKAVTKAETKGAKESLVMTDKVAYIVSVENKTVITAVDDQNMKENVFTNIDSAVIMD
ncbi:TIGR02530 family flagellar biosynthesis protein [Acetohalobium arabaticum]|uniref:Flagellar operon protein n=1 Tax=Acetohalobium arabaticum (strain ATCC 49924 / DSM 5501 / Z-7288) TaxID=574087 RepID=D9QRK2_ACEAZ|nr:TIGR02530 family flagellar biosynthesis protein [Acetohalobium arabaticum]ADL13143.1 flagellar operon protein [Acetohalobium arabaticum DSM 5501]